MSYSYDDLREAFDRIGTVRGVARELGVSRRRVNTAVGRGLRGKTGVVRECSARTVGVGPALLESLMTEVETITEPGTYLLTSAQNDVPVHAAFWSALNKCAEHKGARIMVAKAIYDTSETKNVKDEQDEPVDYNWDDRVLPYVVEVNQRLAPTFEFSAALNILPTAVNPLSGIDFPPRVSSAVPHQKRALLVLPVSHGGKPVYRYTTGSCTLPRHILRKAGQRAEHHHVLGALIVEVDEDGAWFARQISAADDGSFYDLDGYYTARGVKRGGIDHLVCGDIHYAQVEERVMDATFYDEDSIVATLRPNAVVLHDFADGISINHHATLREKYVRHLKGVQRTFDGEMAAVADGLIHIQGASMGADVVVVSSNHCHEFLEKWLNKGEQHVPAHDSKAYHHLHYLWRVEMEAGDEEPPLLPLALKVATGGVPDNIRFLRVDEPYSRCGVFLGNHGHLGPGGARGSAVNLSKLAEKCTIGHLHTPQIKEGVYVAGHSCKRKQGYNSGPSTWDFAHVVCAPDGHRQIISFWETNNNAPLRWRGGQL